MENSQQLDEFEQEDLQVIRELWAQHLTEEAAMKYTVTVTRTEFAVIDVIAASEEEAEEAAYLEATENYEDQCWETSSIDMVTGEGKEEDDTHIWPRDDVFDTINAQNA